MPVYEIEMLDKRGKQVKATLEAGSEEVIVEKVRDLGYYPLRVEAAKSGTFLAAPLAENPAEAKATRQARETLAAAEASFATGESPFEELVATVEGIAQASTGCTPGFQQEMQRRLRELQSAPIDPEALRAEMRAQADRVAALRAGDPKAYATERFEIATGWLREPMGERFGVLCMGGNRDLVWVDLDPTTLQPTAVESLCSFEEFENIRVAGFLRRRAVMHARGGGNWEIRLDRRRSSANVGRLRRIIDYELAQARTDGSS